MALFQAQGVETRRYFWPPLHRLPAWRGRFDLPVTDAVADSLLCLPLHSRMDEPTLQRIEAAIRAVGDRLVA
jgi:dTDP-4-amino-4,6-dideoxygalactose transaminase